VWAAGADFGAAKRLLESEEREREGINRVYNAGVKVAPFAESGEVFEAKCAILTRPGPRQNETKLFRQGDYLPRPSGRDTVGRPFIEGSSRLACSIPFGCSPQRSPVGPPARLQGTAGSEHWLTCSSESRALSWCVVGGEHRHFREQCVPASVLDLGSSRIPSSPEDCAPAPPSGKSKIPARKRLAACFERAWFSLDDAVGKFWRSPRHSSSELWSESVNDTV